MSDQEQVINWKALWETLDWDDESRKQAALRDRLKQRASQYATLLPDAISADFANIQTYLTFKLGQEMYAMDVMQIHSVRAVERITPVPGAPHFYRGVVNIRGQIITVLDLRLFFDMEVDARDVPEELIVVKVNNLEIGVLAHMVQDVMSIRDKDIEPIDDIRYARGITGNHIMLLDIVRLFEDERLIVGGAEE